MMGAVAVLATTRVPNAPLVGCQYKSTQTITTDETTSTWNAVDIGTPHPDRIVILAIFAGVNGDVTAASVNGIPFFHKTRINEFAICACRVPNDTTARIEVSATSSIRKAVSVMVAYPQNPIPLDSGTATANTTTNANVADQKVQRHGCLVYAGGQLATLGTFTTTWNGTDSLVEDVDAQLESASSYTAGHINITISSDTSDVDLGESASGTKRLVVCTWGPPRPGVTS